MENTTHQSSGIWEKNRMLIKGFMIGFLILIMLIPVAMLSGLVSEREELQNTVTNEISSKWATQQTITGPVMMIPYLTSNDTAKRSERKYIYYLPEKLDINGKILPEVRHRSLYEVTLYRSNLFLTGMFDPAGLSKAGIPAENILWSECQLMVGLNDARGLEDEVQLQWDTATHVLEAGVPDNSAITSGLSTKVVLDANKKVSFRVNIKVKGSSYLYFTPVGKTTEVTIASTWKDPAFDGQYLPSQPAIITDSGFNAHWKILQVSRNYPQLWKNSTKYDIESASFGIRLIQPTDGYAKTQRTVKYALLIIALTFTIFFFVEIFQKRQIHPLQYILVGIALCVFYSLLLSISEYTGFNTAYLLASAATVTLISLYILGIFKKTKIVAGFAASLGGLYAYIFILIQLKDYALLFGSIGLFIILAVIMFYSRKIDWYGTTPPKLNIPENE
jgi:inner membrane protein